MTKVKGHVRVCLRNLIGLQNFCSKYKLRVGLRLTTDPRASHSWVRLPVALARAGIGIREGCLGACVASLLAFLIISSDKQ